MYNFALLVGKSSLKSSHRMQSKVVLEDWISVCANLILTESLWEVSQPGLSLPKYLRMKLFASFLANPAIFHRVSQRRLTSLPDSCRDVKRTRQFGSSLLWASLTNNSCLLWSASSKPSSTNKTLDWFPRINFLKFDFDSSSNSWGRSWSLMASQMSDLISWHLSSSSSSIIGNDSSQFS